MSILLINLTVSIGMESVLTDDENIRDIIELYGNHESSVKIQSALTNAEGECGFFFSETSIFRMYVILFKKLKKWQRSNATGCDGLPVRIIKKMCTDILCHIFTVLVLSTLSIP